LKVLNAQKQRIEIITFVYNEEFLLPFFLKHYDWVDRINVIYDQDSTDKTLEILNSNRKVNVIPFRFPDMMDDVLKVNKINEVYRNLKPKGWVIVVDCDEFIFIDRKKIERLQCYVSKTKLFNVYRNVSDSDLDVNKPIKGQRCHGVFDEVYNKPIIARIGLDLAWHVGNHNVLITTPFLSKLNLKIKKSVLRQESDAVSENGIIGAHWANADTCFCVKRRVIDRRDRQSKFNLDNHLTYQHHNITVECVLNECESHEHDNLVF
jgi:hypothetical protein